MYGATQLRTCGERSLLPLFVPLLLLLLLWSAKMSHSFFC